MNKLVVLLCIYFQILIILLLAFTNVSAVPSLLLEKTNIKKREHGGENVPSDRDIRIKKASLQRNN
jgi:hypothetical protein